MTLEDRVRLANYCFGCGQMNPSGFHLNVEVEGNIVYARYQPRPEDQGFPGTMHGGLISALLDEVMGWAMVKAAVWAVTARMETRFRRPVPLTAALRAEASVEQRRGRALAAHARLLDDATGELLVESDALFMRVPPEEHERLTAIYQPENWIGAD